LRSNSGSSNGWRLAMEGGRKFIGRDDGRKRAN